MKIRGYDAISVAEKLTVPISKYGGQDEGFRTDVPIDEANEIASFDQNYLFVDLDISKLDTEELLALAAALGACPDESFEQSGERFDRDGDDDRAVIFAEMAKRWKELIS